MAAVSRLMPPFGCLQQLALSSTSVAVLGCADSLAVLCDIGDFLPLPLPVSARSRLAAAGAVSLAFPSLSPRHGH
jgi:hypothetical protein